MSNLDQIKGIIDRLPHLSPFQVDTIDRIIRQLQCKVYFERNTESKVVTDCVLRDFGDTLLIHHVFSAEALSKDRFEFAFEKVLSGCGFEAHRAPRGNPGHDITINGIRCSLKTQADKNIKSDFVHISKFMEMGKGDWTDQPEQLVGLRSQFLEHMGRYDRIFTLRRLRDVTLESYELVEIHKHILEKAEAGELVMMTGSKQLPKPGYCYVRDKNKALMFELYFDGGTERKLQVRKLRSGLCTVHATWKFPRREADLDPVFNEE